MIYKINPYIAKSIPISVWIIVIVGFIFPIENKLLYSLADHPLCLCGAAYDSTNIFHTARQKGWLWLSGNCF